MSAPNPQRRVIRSRRRRGMTLIEVMIVMVIVALMMGVVGVALIPQLEKGKRNAARQQLGNFNQALKTYYVSKSKYPDTGTGLRALVDAKVMDSVPQDPWGNDYVYLNEGGKPVVMTYSKDGAPGGADDDADIKSTDPMKTE
jgi:general secretion pathway protein G